MKSTAVTLKKRRRKIIAGAVILTGAVLILRHFFHEYVVVDSCFDNGGRWNKEKNICEYEEK